jgi:hypothetical protein
MQISSANFYCTQHLKCDAYYSHLQVHYVGGNVYMEDIKLREEVMPSVLWT